MSMSAKIIMRYCLMPGIMPRFQKLFGVGLSHTAFFAASLFGALGILPHGHPYLSGASAGRFGVSHVIVESWHQLRRRRGNIDHYILFGIVVLGMAIMAAQLGLLGFALLAKSALALPGLNHFVTANPTQDIAFILLDRVFGIGNGTGGNNLFNSCVAQNVSCLGVAADGQFPWPYHIALHQMIAVYNAGIVIAGIVILAYQVITITMETVKTGTPFGKRFNRMWAPLRIAVAFGLIIPITAGGVTGLNSAQYIALYAAKFGSGFASNAWANFVVGGLPASNATMTVLGPADRLVGRPKAPPVNSILEFGTVVATCVRAEALLNGRNIRAWLINSSNVATPSVELWPAAAAAPVTFYDSGGVAGALSYSNNNDIRIVFGEFASNANNSPVHTSFPGHIRPYCGEIKIEVPDVPTTQDPTTQRSPGSNWATMSYYMLVANLMWPSARDATQTMWGTVSMGDIADRVVRRTASVDPNHDPTLTLATANELDAMKNQYRLYADNLVDQAVTRQRQANWTPNIFVNGWGGAGMWFTRVAEMNGNLISAIYAMPYATKYPEVMETVYKEKKKTDKNIIPQERFKPFRADGSPITFSNPRDMMVARTLYEAQQVWKDAVGPVKPSGNIFVDVVNLLFGTDALFSMVTNNNIHPLAQLSIVGRSILESAIRNLGFSFMAGMGGFASLFGYPAIGHMAEAISSIASKMAMVGLTVGFLLYYIIPFMPFIYFLFAVGGWIKGVFEAIVGVPLWALAHLHIDGDGLPSRPGMDGYYLILEIFLRPVLIVFGMLGCIAIFTAQIAVLHEIWSLVVSNLAGFDKATAAGVTTQGDTGNIFNLRGAIDQIFFTVIYAFLVYLFATASFKMVDTVPDFILRWIGASVATFGDRYADQVENLVTGSAFKAGFISSKLVEASQQGMQAAKSTGAAVKDVMKEGS